MAAPLSEREIARELAAYGVELGAAALAQLSCYLELLLRWNQRFNLTGVREPRQIVRRLFGESLFLASVVELRGWLVDVGSGAGFPGLALKLAAPELRVTLVESRRKKCVFLKEVVRECGFSTVDVVGARFEAWVRAGVGEDRPSMITTRAVKVDEELLALMHELLAPEGRTVLLSSMDLAARIQKQSSGWRWEGNFEIPQAPGRVALVGSCIKYVM